MSTPAADSRRSRLILPLLAVAAAAALSACGSAASSAAPASTPAATTPSASSPAATSAVSTPSDAGSGTAAATASRPPTAKSGTTSRAGIVGDPWKNPTYKVGFFSPPASVGGEPDPIVVEYGRYVPPLAGTDGWGVSRTGKRDRLQLAPGARFFAYCTYAGMRDQGDPFKLCPLTHDQFAALVIAKQKDQQEFWFTVDAKGRPNLLFQVYHS